MEALAILGAGAYLASSLMGKHSQPALDQSDAAARTQKIDTPEDLVLQQAAVGGIIAPQYNFAAARVPWDPQNPPITLHRVGMFPQEATPSDMYQAYTNAIGHQRHDAVEAMQANRPQFARRRGQPLWTAFTPELSDVFDKERRTQHMQWNWLPRNGSGLNDSDFADASALAKALPPDANLWTPDGWWATAAGVPWRYSNY